MPVTSPIAHTPLASPQAASTAIPWGSASDADRLEAEVVDARPSPGRRRGCGRRVAAAVVELEDELVALPPRGGRLARRARARCLLGGAPRRAPRRAAQARGRAGAPLARRSSPRRRSGERPAPSRRRPARRRAPAAAAERPSFRSPRGSSTRLRARAGRERAERTGRRRWRGRHGRPCSVAPVDLDHARSRRAGHVPRTRSMPLVRQPALLPRVGVLRRP